MPRQTSFNFSEMHRRGALAHSRSGGVVALVGVAVALVYFVAASYVWSHVPIRLLYDGVAPPLPYRWIHPPANLAAGNQAPEPGTGTITFAPDGSASASVLTNDAQAGLILSHGGVAPRPGVTSAQASIVPVDPNAIALPPPGLRFDGNAYRMEARYSTGEPVALLKPVTPVLRYPVHATALLRSNGRGWVQLDSKRVEESLQVFARSDQLGVFVAAGPAGPASTPWIAYAAGGAGVIAAAAAFLLARRHARRKPVTSAAS